MEWSTVASSKSRRRSIDEGNRGPDRFHNQDHRGGGSKGGIPLPKPLGAAGGPPARSHGGGGGERWEDAERLAKESPELHCPWVFWEHRELPRGSARERSSDSYHHTLGWLGECSTVGSFWQIMNNIPCPSDFFASARTKRSKVGSRTVEGLSLFRRGIRPEWEDAYNNGGGEWNAKCGDLKAADGWWRNMCLALVGESFGEPGMAITGVRIVDKSDGRGHVGYRVEVWFAQGADEKALKASLLQLMPEDVEGESPKLQNKPHGKPAEKKPFPGIFFAVNAAESAAGTSEGGAPLDPKAAAESKIVWARQMRSILCKMTPEKFNRIAPQFKALVSGAGAEGIDTAADLVHKNAVLEDIFSEMFADTCKALDDIKGFREALVNRCKTKFANRVTDVREAGEGNEVLSRKRGRANTKFIGELFKRGLITTDIIIHCIKALVDCAKGKEGETVDDRGVHVEVLCEMLMTVGKHLESPQQSAGGNVARAMAEVTDLSKDGSLIPRLRFKLEELLELRANRWNPRREKAKPQTKDEIAASGGRPNARAG